MVNIQGGSAHNAIPRDAQADICFPETSLELVQDIVSQCSATLGQEFKNTDPELNLSLSAGDGQDKSLSPENTDKLVNILLVFPHGVAAMSSEIKDLVETSNNQNTLQSKEFGGIPPQFSYPKNPLPGFTGRGHCSKWRRLSTLAAQHGFSFTKKEPLIV